MQIKLFKAIELSDLPVNELVKHNRRIPDISLGVELYPLRYRYYRHVPVAIRQTLAAPFWKNLWAGYDARLGTANSQGKHVFLPFLMLYSREIDMYFKAGAECANTMAFYTEVAKDSPTHQYLFKACFRSHSPVLSFEGRTKQLGGVCFKSKGPRCDFGLVYRGKLGGCAVNWRATMDLNARHRLAPGLKASISRPIATFGATKCYFKAARDRVRVGLEVTANIGRYPITLQAEFDGKVVLWAGIRLPGIGLRVPAWIIDPQELAFSDCVGAGAFFAGVAALLLAAKKVSARRLREERKRFDARLAAKLQSDNIISRRRVVGERKIDVLFAAVGKERALEGLCFAPFPFADSLTAYQPTEMIDITQTCRFYADNHRLELPADKTHLLGYLRPFGADQKGLRVLIVYQKHASPSSESPLRLLQLEDRALSITV